MKLATIEVARAHGLTRRSYGSVTTYRKATTATTTIAMPMQTL